MRFQQFGAAVHRGDQAIGYAPLARGIGKFRDDRVPYRLLHQLMDIAVGDDLDIAFTKRDEEDDARSAVGRRQNMRGEFAMREIVCMVMFDVLGNQQQAQGQPFE